MPSRQFIDDILSFQIRDSTVFVSADGLEYATPLRKFRLGMARAAKALAAYDEAGEVVPMGKRKGDHAAKS